MCDLSSACSLKALPPGHGRKSGDFVSWHQETEVCDAGVWLSDNGAYHAQGPGCGLALKLKAHGDRLTPRSVQMTHGSVCAVSS